MAESYTTIAGRARAELKVRGSRFIGTALPISSREEAQHELDALRKEFWDATHNCYAWRLAPDGLLYRFSDDGEPSGSAGKPMLFVLQQRELLNVMVVVTRYFGGTRLGIGGLVRAYTDATVAALDATSTSVYHPTEVLQVFTTYEDMRAVRQLVETYAEHFDEEFRDVVTYRAVIRQDRSEEFAERLTETSQGRAGLVRLTEVQQR